jgi:hypothetical protein
MGLFKIAYDIYANEKGLGFAPVSLHKSAINRTVIKFRLAASGSTFSGQPILA